MRALIRKESRSGAKRYETVERIENIVLLDDVKAVMQIGNDFKVCKPVKGMARRDGEKG